MKTLFHGRSALRPLNKTVPVGDLPTCASEVDAAASPLPATVERHVCSLAVHRAAMNTLESGTLERMAREDRDGAYPALLDANFLATSDTASWPGPPKPAACLSTLL